MRRLLPLLMMMGLAGLLVGCAGEPDTVTVSGKAERELMPDYYEISLLLVERGEDEAALSEALEERLANVISLAREHGLEEDDIRAWELELHQETHWDRDEQRRVTGEMRLSRQVRLQVDVEQEMGPLLGALITTGWTQIQGVRSRLADPEALRNDLLGEAVANARSRASALAAGDGRQVGTLLQLQEGDRSRPMMARAELMQAPEAVSFMPEPITVSAEVQAVFRLD
ncbi:SIMPL domain-containing protein [Gammaproteobacteria bacterium AB-CW1]|uniref:SIMPL domain-containing protein n=1 Tax=Natronospira elongata TaxID=3110268 RepID=A0AAP6JDM6_9GAMM|nr:SIMPL domain-containing protein [Gammaproteobacteria bacterium AB-CW1]